MKDKNKKYKYNTNLYIICLLTKQKKQNKQDIC